MGDFDESDTAVDRVFVDPDLARLNLLHDHLIRLTERVTHCEGRMEELFKLFLDVLKKRQT